jgi:hypothetical protein
LNSLLKKDDTSTFECSAFPVTVTTSNLDGHPNPTLPLEVKAAAWCRNNVSMHVPDSSLQETVDTLIQVWPFAQFSGCLLAL